jgi:UDP-2,3-diacylglucosamine hydrolase
MPSAYFVSDIHIMSPDCERAREFLAFLGSLSRESGTTHLVLLGDIFDLWVADHDYFIAKYQAIIDEIRRLTNEGVEISYFEGNHDLHLEHFWQERLGLTVHGGPAYVAMGSRTVRLEHGDQMDPDDTGYRFLRWFLRTPPIRFLVRHLPGGLIARIGDRASAASRDYTSNTKTIDRDAAIGKIRAHARKAYAERPFDLIISGHVHIRDDCRLESGGAPFRSVNLGSWLDAPCYFKLDEDGERFHEIAVAS